MSTASQREIFFSFFMFTVDAKPEDPAYTGTLIRHLQALSAMGYDGFDLHIAPRAANIPHSHEIESYCKLKKAFNDAGLENAKFATNVGTTPYFDPTSPYQEQRDAALEYLRSRVLITKMLGDDSYEPIMSGPFIYPYGAFPVDDLGNAMWSDALLDWMKPRLDNAKPVIEEVARFAAEHGVKLAIEPVKNWETPPPNMVSDVLDFLEDIEVPCGITVDTAQSLMESQGPSVFKENIARAVSRDRLNYIHISAPDRGAVNDSWIPWEFMLGEIEPVFRGPYLIEVFNAIPPLDAGMRMTRRRFWRPGEDADGPPELSAYNVAAEALKELNLRLDQVTTPRHGATFEEQTHVR